MTVNFAKYHIPQDGNQSTLHPFIATKRISHALPVKLLHESFVS